jgi:class 3 adenylate cyclase
MQIRASLLNTAVQALVGSVDVHTMVVIARRLMDRYYDLHERTGFQRSIPIPNLDAARQIVADIRDSNQFLSFVNLLVEMQEEGLMGRTYSIPHLRELVRGVHELGFDYDHENRMFVEDPRVRKTRNWGVLRSGHEYVFAFLRLDIVGNTTLVKKHGRQAMQSVYRDLGAIVQKAVERRNGRIWSWEGDGGLACFYFANKNTEATLAAVEITHELFLYNKLGVRFPEELKIRMAIHTGTSEYSEREEDLKNSETIKRTINIESQFTKAGSVTVSNTVYTTLEPRVANQLQPIKTKGAAGHYRYEIRWES